MSDLPKRTAHCPTFRTLAGRPAQARHLLHVTGSMPTAPRRYFSRPGERIDLLIIHVASSLLPQTGRNLSSRVLLPSLPPRPTAPSAPPGVDDIFALLRTPLGPRRRGRGGVMLASQTCAAVPSRPASARHDALHYAVAYLELGLVECAD